MIVFPKPTYLGLRHAASFLNTLPGPSIAVQDEAQTKALEPIWALIGGSSLSQSLLAPQVTANDPKRKSL